MACVDGYTGFTCAYDRHAHVFLKNHYKVRSLNFSMVPNQREHTLIINKNEGDGPIADDQLR